MTIEISQWLWMLIDVILLLVLGGALVYAVLMWSRRKRSPEANSAREQATEKVYREAEKENRDEMRM